jgi:hypothetical protein
VPDTIHTHGSHTHTLTHTHTHTQQKNVDAAERAGFIGVLYDAYTSTETDLEEMLTVAGLCLEPDDDSDADQ